MAQAPRAVEWELYIPQTEECLRIAQIVREGAVEQERRRGIWRERGAMHVRGGCHESGPPRRGLWQGKADEGKVGGFGGEGGLTRKVRHLGSCQVALPRSPTVASSADVEFLGFLSLERRATDPVMYKATTWQNMPPWDAWELLEFNLGE
jgi:hypothetical protein